MYEKRGKLGKHFSSWRISSFCQFRCEHLFKVLFNFYDFWRRKESFLLCVFFQVFVFVCQVHYFAVFSDIMMRKYFSGDFFSCLTYKMWCGVVLNGFIVEFLCSWHGPFNGFWVNLFWFFENLRSFVETC